MIGFLKGKVLDVLDGKVILGVGPADGSSYVGYSLTVPQSSEYRFLVTGSTLEVYIHTHVREDALDLYGFLKREEKDIFLTLIGVSGIGPKVGLSILSGAEFSELVLAILDEDKAFLTRLPGVGKKTAERVVLELADKLRKKVENGTLKLHPVSSSRPTHIEIGAESSSKPEPAQSDGKIIRETTDALVGLGYREADISALLHRMTRELKDSKNVPIRTEEMIRLALRQLS
jgi:Holliday junction DNA helicase RuvA